MDLFDIIKRAQDRGYRIEIRRGSEEDTASITLEKGCYRIRRLIGIEQLKNMFFMDYMLSSMEGILLSEEA